MANPESMFWRCRSTFGEPSSLSLSRRLWENPAQAAFKGTEWPRLRGEASLRLKI